VGDLFAIIAPVFICTALGWAWVRAGRAYDRELLTILIADIGAPCLVFSRLVALEVEAEAMAEMAVAAAISLAAVALVGILVLRLARLPFHTFLCPLVFGNQGNMGLPVCLFAFGEEGLALGIAYFSVTATLQFTAGISIWSGRFSLRELARTPLIYAVGLAVAVLASGETVPGWICNTTEILGGFAIPLMLVTLGASLAELRVSKIGRGVALACCRLGIGFGVGVGLAALLDFSGVARGVLVLQCAMPAAVFNYLFAQRYARAPEEVAGIVVISTLLAFALLPPLLGFLL
jgi:predicted permease